MFECADGKMAETWKQRWKHDFVILGIILVGFGTGILTQLAWAIVSRNSVFTDYSFFFGFLGGILDAAGFALILSGHTKIV